MKDVELSDALAQTIGAHAREAYPEECCGFLVVRAHEPDAGPRKVVSVDRARNQFDGERARRFVIPPEELREVEGRLEGTGLMVGGFYHSHPDHPALPSEFDRDHAWPWYSYLILGVTGTTEGPLAAFELDPESGLFVPTRLASPASSGWSLGKRTPKNLLGEEGTP